jgi:hypothetical protein
MVAPATTTRSTTVSTTTPQLGAPPPTLAPLIDSSIPGRVALNNDTQEHEQVSIFIITNISLLNMLSILCNFVDLLETNFYFLNTVRFVIVD